jgi:hypothetical protein
MKPTLPQITAYAKSQNIGDYGLLFLARMEEKQWITSAGQPVKDWELAYKFFVKRHETKLETEQLVWAAMNEPEPTEEPDRGHEMLANAIYVAMYVFAALLVGGAILFAILK